MTRDLSDDALARLTAAASRRGLSVDAVVTELASGLPDSDNDSGVTRRLGFFALGSSTDHRSAADAEEILTEGFGND